MKLLKTILSGSSLYEGNLTIDLTASQRISEEAKRYLNKITDTVFTNPVIEFAGLNASGKTMTLRMLRFVINLLNGEKLNNSCDKEVILEMIENEPMVILSFYYWEKEFYALKTKIGYKNSKSNPGEKEIVILEEKLFKQKPKIKVTKTNWSNDPESRSGFYDSYIDRKNAGIFLSDDISINVSIINQEDTAIKYCDFLEAVNHNSLKVIGEYLPEIIHFLDPNIEYFRMETFDNSRNTRWLLKFKNQPEEYILNSFRDVEFYLSSGTIKGIGVFTMAIAMFYEGGYILVDELENHFNLKIVKSLLEFFMNHRTNRSGGTIIFSTHYPELLDVPARNDAIYILSSTDKITCTNLSDLKKRNDGQKNSQAYIQNLLEVQTAPSHAAYMNLKNAIETISCVKTKRDGD